MLILDALQFRHRSVDEVYNFSMTVEPSEVVGIMGASGSGKSTLLDLISGFLRPKNGVLNWNGQNLVPLPPEDRPVTTLFQHHNLFEHLSAFRNVAVGINPARKISSKEGEQVTQALAKVGLAEKRDQRASTLSGGQQQRVALARAIVRDCPILLLDEPFIGLDEETKSQMLSLVDEQAVKAGKCVIMVTHDASDCEAIATKRYLVEQGQLMEA